MCISFLIYTTKSCTFHVDSRITQLEYLETRGFKVIKRLGYTKGDPKISWKYAFPSLRGVWAALTLLLYCLCSLQKLVYFLRTSLSPCTIEQIRKIFNHQPLILRYEYFHHYHFLYVELLCLQTSLVIPWSVQMLKGTLDLQSNPSDYFRHCLVMFNLK